MDAVVTIGIHIPVALEAADDVDDGSAGDGVEVTNAGSLEDLAAEPGSLDDVGPVVPLVGIIDCNGETA